MSGCDCGCCAGVDAETPSPIDNPHGQPVIAYRAGVHATFKESLLARLSDPDLPALAELTTREDDDFSIALCDGLATALDVLTFYQERIANENLLRTATERRSVLELARLIGYEPAPGVAASTDLAFTLQEVPGSPELAAGPVEIPIGSRVQSVPGPGEQPQTFETVEAVEARAEWNAIPVQSTLRWQPRRGDVELWLAGVGTNVAPGDAILVVGRERLADVGSERWDVRVVTRVEEDTVALRTRLTWDLPLGSVVPDVKPAASGISVYVFRQRAALFGHNAPDPRLLSGRGTKLSQLSTGSEWKNYEITGGVIDLDADYPKVVPGSWVALVAAGAAPYMELYRAVAVDHLTRRAFGLSAKTTRVRPDTDEHLTSFELRETTVLAQTEALTTADPPLGYPLYGTTITLDRVARGIGPGRALAVTGKRACTRLRKGSPPVTMALEAGGTVRVREGDVLRLTAPPERQVGAQWVVLSPEELGDVLATPGPGMLRLWALDRDERAGKLAVAAARIELVPAGANDASAAEVVHIGDLPSAVVHDRDRTTCTLAAALAHCYDRATVRVNANVARATHGESVTEILGSGDARVANAAFRLQRPRLTFVSAATPSGREPTLQVRVNDLRWDEAGSLYGRGPAERAYEVAIDDESRATVRFGDGVEGARLPSGDHNVRATYRHGLGLAGNVAAGRVTNLLSRPLGVTAAVNPAPASGGDDPEDEDRARDNAPRTVLTLERAVSVHDYRHFARAFAGVAKAHALWIPTGPARGVFLTLAGEEGAPVPPGSDTHTFLEAALRRYGDPLVPLRIETYRDARFRARLTVKVAADADANLVLPAVRTAIEQAFGFAARDFGQGVSVDEVAAVAQGVAGVEAIHVVELRRTGAGGHVVELRRTGAGGPVLVPRIFAEVPLASLGAAPVPAELLTVDTGAIVLSVLP